MLTAAGSGIAPFLPIPPEPSGIALPFHIFLYICRMPLLLFFSIAYFALFQFLPFGVLGRKASLWCILGIPGIWWIDLQIDGVKKGCASPMKRWYNKADTKQIFGAT
jgi:1-acylglycerol-3-phosphate O-acyltransferase